MNEFIDTFNGTLALGIGYVAVLLPVFILLVIFVYDAKNKKNRYDALITISKNINNPEDIKEILESLVERKSPTDYRRSGVITIGIGVGLFLFDKIGLGTDVISGVGLLVLAIGVGQIIAGYLYPIESEEINKAVEEFEKK
jgi:cbb3-type cytochrome oxidase subunit 3